MFVPACHLPSYSEIPEHNKTEILIAVLLCEVNSTISRGVTDMPRIIYIAKAIQNQQLLKYVQGSHICRKTKQNKKPQRAAVFLTVGGLQSLSLYVKSSYSTTPKLQMSEATENLLSVRDSGAYLSQRTTIHYLTNTTNTTFFCESFCSMCFTEA